MSPTSRARPLRPVRRGPAALLLLLIWACSMDASEPLTTAGADRADALVSIGDIRWYSDYELAVAEARRRDAPLWVHFGENPG